MYTPEQVERKASALRMAGLEPEAEMLDAYAATLKAAQGERMPVPFYVGRNHPNQAYVTLGFDSEDACDQFYKAITRGKDLYTAPPAQPAAQGDAPRGEVVAWQIETDDDVERVAKAAGWDNRRYMTPTDYAIWCNRMRDFVRIAVDVPQPFVPPAQPAERVPDGWVLVPAEAGDTDAFMVLHEYQQPGRTRKDAYRIAIRKLAERAKESLAATPRSPAEEGDGKEGGR